MDPKFTHFNTLKETFCNVLETLLNHHCPYDNYLFNRKFNSLGDLLRKNQQRIRVYLMELTRAARNGGIFVTSSVAVHETITCPVPRDTLEQPALQATSEVVVLTARGRGSGRRGARRQHS